MELGILAEGGVAMGEEEDEEEEEVVVGFVLGVFVDMSFLANLLGDGLDTSVFNSAGNLRGLLLGPSFGVEVAMEGESAVLLLPLHGLFLSPSFGVGVAMEEEEDEEEEEGVVDFGFSGGLRGLLLGPSFGVEVTMEEEGGEEGEEGVVDFGGLSCGVVDDLEQVVVVVEQVVVMVEQVEVRAVVCGGAGTVGLMS
jgi:hypothetical protein